MGGYSFRSGVGRAAPIGLRHVVRHKGRIVAVDGAGRVKKHGPQVLLDVADLVVLSRRQSMTNSM